MKIPKKISFTILPLLIIVAIDQNTKYLALYLREPLIYGPFKFALVKNFGVMLGYFTYLPLNVKEVILLTFGSFLMASYLLAIWLLPIRSRATYLGLSILVGGIMGNVIDRFDGFAVIDFLSLNITGKNIPYMNFADISQWIGHLFIMSGLYRDSLYYWPKKDWRNKFIIDPFFQIRSSLYVALCSFLAGSIMLIFSYAFLKSNQSPKTLNSFIATGLMVSFIFSLFTFLVSLVVTHRVAGPVYAIKRHLLGLINNTYPPFKLREHDEFKDVEQSLNSLTEEIKEIKDIYPPPLPKDFDKKEAA